MQLVVIALSIIFTYIRENQTRLVILCYLIMSFKKPIIALGYCDGRGKICLFHLRYVVRI